MNAIRVLFTRRRISKTIEALRAEYCDLDRVHEIWIADTATFEPTKDYVEFLRLVKGEHAESFTFYRGKLESIARDGMPVPI